MTSADVRDMLDLPQDGHARAPPLKKQKAVEKRPEGITRELFALLGERAPPVAISEHVKYKGRPKWTHKTQPWEMAPFTNPAREDALVLKHWRKKVEPKPAPNTAQGEASGATAENQENPSTSTDPAYYFSKYNVTVTVPEYTAAEYDQHLQHPEWTKEETDYLIDLCKDFGLRWVVIADRYDYQPAEAASLEGDNTLALVTQARKRTMEVLKARYYAVARKMMEVRTGLPNMTKAEQELYDKMKFNATQEATRKQMAENLMKRSPEEVRDEELLLTELRRVINTQEKLLDDRKELYARLESPPSSGTNTRIYETSQGLTQLIQMLVMADKGKKRNRSVVGLNGIEMASSPAIGGPSGPSVGVGTLLRDGKDTPRESVGGGTGSNKKGAPPPPAERRKLSPQEEKMYGVTHHDRLTSGVQFRNDKVIKLVQAKSNIQAQRVQAALAELQVPPRLVMPTAKVCAEYERLVQNIHTLLDVRKVSEKIEGEIKVLLAQKEEREKKEREGRGEGSGEPEEDKEKKEGEGDVDMDAPQEDKAGQNDANQVKEEKEDDETSNTVDGKESAEPASTPAAPPRPGTSGGHKRSASVMSAVSEKSSKRMKK